MPRSLIALLIVSGLLLVAWSFAVPIFEAPDEPAHAANITYVHDHGWMPLYAGGYVEANQPPLYYFMVSALRINVAFEWFNPRDSFYRGAAPVLFQHSDTDWVKYWDVRIVRLETGFMSLLTVLVCYFIGLEITGTPSTGILTAGLIAFLPQFTFHGSNISNDALVLLASVLATLWIVRLIRRGFTWRDGVIASVLTGFAFLSKVNAVFFPAPLSFAILTNRTPWLARLMHLSVLIVGLAIVLPWLVYNQLLYGDILAQRAMLTVVKPLVNIQPITSPYFRTVFPEWLYKSSVGVFGWMNLALPDWIYWSFGLLVLISVLGYLQRMRSHTVDIRVTIILSSMVLANLALVVYLNLMLNQPQGRYLFPAFPAMAAFVALGLEGIPRWSRRATYLLVSMLAVLNVYILRTSWLWVIGASKSV